MFKKAKLYSLLALIVASTVVGLVSFPQTANAQEQDLTPWDDLRVLNDANTVTLTHIVSYCMVGTSKNNTSDNTGTDIAPTQNNIRDGDWFTRFDKKSNETDNQFAYRSYAIPAGYGIEEAGDDGKIACNDDSFNVSQRFISLGGWSDNKTAACDIGFRMEGKGGNDDGDNRGYANCLAFDESNSNKLYLGQIRSDRGDEDPLDGSLLQLLPRGENKTGGYGYNDIQLYLLYKVAFTGPCGANIIGPSSTTSGYGKTLIVNKSGTPPIEVDYDLPDGNKDKEVPVYYGTAIKCSDLPGLMADTAPAYGAWMRDHQDGAESANTEYTGGTSVSTCQITGIGWLVCPLFTFLADITDGTYRILESFLKLQPVNMQLDSDTNGTYRAWKIMRDFANVVFVIAFLFIVFSQITSIGISNYGLKRLLPKLVVAAVLVNVSYFMCAVLVDLSNILGAQLNSLLSNIADSIIPPDNETTLNSDGSDILWQSIVKNALAVGIGAGLIASTTVTLPLVGAALLFILPIIVTVVIVMVLRQAAIILLIFISPLAFVALLLPNTESYFKKWQQLLKTMLLLYPMVALTFGGGALASAVLMASATSYNDLSALHGIAAAAVRILPLVLIPTLMKIASGAFGKITGMVNDKQKGWFDNARNTRMENHRYNQAQAADARSKNPNRRKSLDRFTPLGSSIRANKRKSRISDTETLLGNAYLRSAEGREDHIESAQLDTEKQIAENRIKRVVAQRADRNLVATAEEQKLGVEEAENLLARDVASRVNTNIRTDVKNSELEKQTAENSAEAAAIHSTSTRAATAAKKAELDKQTAENNLQTAVTQSVSGSVADRSQRRSELELQAAKTGADANWAGRTIEESDLSDLTKEVQTNQSATGVAQGVTTRRFNKEMADGTVDVTTALGTNPTGSAAKEVEKAVTAAKTEAGEKEVRREQQALQEHLATLPIEKRDEHLVDTAKDTTDSYEFISAVNEAARLGRDGALRSIQDNINLSGGTKAEIDSKLAIVQEAIGSNANALLAKAPHFVKGTGAFDDMDDGQLSTISKDTAKDYINYIEGLVADALSSGDTKKKAKADMVMGRFVGAMEKNYTNPAGKIKGDAGIAILESVGKISNPSVATYMNTGMSDGLRRINPSTGQIIK